MPQASLGQYFSKLFIKGKKVNFFLVQDTLSKSQAGETMGSTPAAGMFPRSSQGA